jgi:hypothetical protein
MKRLTAKETRRHRYAKRKLRTSMLQYPDDIVEGLADKPSAMSRAWQRRVDAIELAEARFSADMHRLIRL